MATPGSANDQRLRDATLLVLEHCEQFGYGAVKLASSCQPTATN